MHTDGFQLSLALIQSLVPILPRLRPSRAAPGSGASCGTLNVSTRSSRGVPSSAIWIEKHTRLAREEGVQEGRKEGQQDVLLRQLTRRFGALPEAVTARVMGAGREELERWSDRILDAATLDDVFASS